jgi:GT2 family glycosyltransferase
MLSRATVERVGLYNDELFAYFEDVDLSFRARHAGLKLVCVPAATIRHEVSASTRRTLAQGTTSALKHYLLARNRLIIIDRYAARPVRWFHLMVVTPLRTCFYIAAFAMRGRWSKLRWLWRGLIDGIRGRLEMPRELT